MRDNPFGVHSAPKADAKECVKAIVGDISGIGSLQHLHRLKTLALPGFALVGKRFDIEKHESSYGRPDTELDIQLLASLEELVGKQSLLS